LGTDHGDDITFGLWDWAGPDRLRTDLPGGYMQPRFRQCRPVVGKRVSAAMAVVKKAELTTIVHAPSMTALVYCQAPAAGLQVLRGSGVSIWARAPARS
jgi:hypothetical protein